MHESFGDAQKLTWKSTLRRAVGVNLRWMFFVGERVPDTVHITSYYEVLWIQMILILLQ